MKPPVHCKRHMEFKAASSRIENWDLFFQCKSCKEVVVIRKEEYEDYEFNRSLK